MVAKALVISSWGWVWGESRSTDLKGHHLLPEWPLNNLSDGSDHLCCPSAPTYPALGPLLCLTQSSLQSSVVKTVLTSDKAQEVW